MPGFRHEFKHPISFADYQLLRSRLRAILPHDSHANPAGSYRVRSLYFDTPEDKVLREKIDGVDRREKFRLRRYNDDVDYILLEKKSKVRGLCLKEKVQISAKESQDLLTGELSWMRQEERPLVVELYHKILSQRLRPQVMIDYEREPFVYAPGNVRITLDRNIHTSRYSTDFLTLDMPLLPVGGIPILLEVKYDNFIPDLIVDLVRIPNRKAAAFSKYAIGRVYG